MHNERFLSTWWTLKLALGLVFLLEGIDKFFNLLANWTDYVNPTVLAAVPVPPEQIVMGVGILEVLVGIAILTRWTKLGGYLAVLLLSALAVNVIMMGKFYDVAVRDLLLAVVAFALARWTEVRRAEPVTSDARPLEASQAGLLRLNL
jgi:uncharacterized membrane protein YphA (DoxX/SURF4 family)